MVKSDRYPANQPEMERKTFKTTKVFSFLSYTEHAEMLRGDFFGKSDRYPANQREEVSEKKTFKTTKVFSFLPYTETTEMLRGDFFGKKRQVLIKPK